VRLISEGKKQEAEKLQLEAAQDDKAAGIARSRKAAERFRGIAATAGLADPKKAREYYAEAAKLDPGNVNGMVRHGSMEQNAGNLAEAERAYSAVLAMGVKDQNDFELYWATLGLGDIRVDRGNLSAALDAYRRASVEADRITKADPSNLRWRRDHSVAYERVGDVLVAQGDLAGALASYKDAFAITEHLAKADPGNVEWQRDHAVAYGKVGDVLKLQGDLASAQKSYQARLEIISRLAKADPGNAEWQRDLSVTYGKVGDVLKLQGDLGGALAFYKDSLAVFDRLAKADPGNLGWQRDLSVAYDSVGDVLVAQGHRDRAIASYKDALVIWDRLAKADPANARWQYDLALAYWRLAANGDNPKENWTKVVAILKTLDARGRLAPANKKWLAQAEAKVAEAEAQAAFNAGDFTTAAAMRKELADAVEKADTAKNGKAGAETANALGGVAWYELFARQFEAALAASERARSLAPDKVWLASNRAHALMFLGQAEEARAVYLQHKGEGVPEINNNTWEVGVLEDFAEFEKHGLTHPQMAEIRSLLAAAR
jgi:tetratricopeptide (TPR) repeat protein